MKRNGFTLLEVLIATLIMGVAVVGLLSAISTSMRSAARLTDYDRVAILARACHRYWEVHFGCAKAGLVVVPVNHRLQAAEVKHILSDVGAKTAVVDARLADVAATAGAPSCWASIAPPSGWPARSRPGSASLRLWQPRERTAS